LPGNTEPGDDAMRLKTREFLLSAASGIAVTCAAALILLPAVASSAPPVIAPAMAIAGPVLTGMPFTISSPRVR